jgi:hypothetical protein
MNGYAVARMIMQLPDVLSAASEAGDPMQQTGRRWVG